MPPERRRKVGAEQPRPSPFTTPIQLKTNSIIRLKKHRQPRKLFTVIHNKPDLNAAAAQLFLGKSYGYPGAQEIGYCQTYFNSHSVAVFVRKGLTHKFFYGKLAC